MTNASVFTILVMEPVLMVELTVVNGVGLKIITGSAMRMTNAFPNIVNVMALALLKQPSVEMTTVFVMLQSPVVQATIITRI